ncbi:MAG: M81 family metallopeptidase [Planctomycetes bacterium]|nr:M81 family metallopeptidase [Planctomycetota bacterium]
MPRILVAECKQEVSTFSPVRSQYDDFRAFTGHAAFDYHRSAGEEIGGALGVFESAEDIDLAPAHFLSAISAGGVLLDESFAQMSEEFLRALRRAGPADGAYFCLHGAMQTESENDPEGHLLQEARKILGEEIPIVISVDLHGILTDRMIQHADAVVTYHTYPHVDFFETGERAAKLLLRILRDGVRPVVARIKIPVLARGDEMITDTGAIAECIELAKEIESSDIGLSAGVMWSNPFTDVPELCSSSIVVTDGDEQLASEHAMDLANRFWRHHTKMQVPLTSLQDAVFQAAAVSTGTVVMMDAADATSSGASGDSNAILCEATRQGYKGRILTPVVDPTAAQMAFAAGVGATIETTVGGALDPSRYEPLPIKARVRSLSDGEFLSETFGWPWSSGQTAVLEADNATIVVGTRPIMLFDRSWFFANGQNPRHFNMVVVKSPHCEPHMYADWCAKLINVDAPGATSANLRSLGHNICARPIFPLDENVTFEPKVDIWRRR